MAGYLKAEFHLNKVFFGGNVGKDPVFKQAPNIDICEFPLCIPLRRVKPKEEREKLASQGTKDLTDYSGQLWLDIVVFGKAAKPVATRIKTGDRVIVVGRMETSQWTDKDGQRHSRLKVIADDVTNIGGWQVEKTKKGIITSGADDCAVPPPGSSQYENNYTKGQQAIPQPKASDFRKQPQTVTFTPAPPTKAQDDDNLIDAELRGEGYSPF